MKRRSFGVIQYCPSVPHGGRVVGTGRTEVWYVSAKVWTVVYSIYSIVIIFPYTILSWPRDVMMQVGVI